MMILFVRNRSSWGEEVGGERGVGGCTAAVKIAVLIQT